MRAFYLIVLILTFQSSGAQLGLDKLINNQNPDSLLLFQKKADIYFSNDWKFKSLKKQEIDHFKMGYVLTWQKKLDGLLIERSYSFYQTSRFAYAHEQRFLNDTLFSQGYVYLKDDTLSYIIQVIPDKKSMTYKNGSYWDYEVDYYIYEIFRKGVLSCIYKTENRNRYQMLFEKRADKVKLLKGDDCLSIIK